MIARHLLRVKQLPLLRAQLLPKLQILRQIIMSQGSGGRESSPSTSGANSGGSKSDTSSSGEGASEASSSGGNNVASGTAAGDSVSDGKVSRD